MCELRATYLVINDLFLVGLEHIECNHFDECFQDEYDSETVINLVVQMFILFKLFVTVW